MKTIFFVMKENKIKDIEEKKQIDEPYYKSYYNLVKSTVLILSIKNKYLSLYEPIMPKFFLTHHFCHILSELKERYKNKTLDILQISKSAPKIPIPYIKKDYFQEKINFMNDTVYEMNKNITIDINNFKPKNNAANDKFLKNKRERNDNGKTLKNKKNFFFKNVKDVIKLNNPGRKKKNSGEYGIHNKYSNDNMMRKLKNKVIESARKLISRKIKEESDYKLNEIHKIGGEFSQELNIKFNYWFYFQKFKDIFQFKCSTRYRKNFGFNNKYVIEEIYSDKNSNKFILTKKLLEMSFCQYYHEIFLDENPNWKDIFEIPFDEDFYGIKFFYFKIRQNPDYSAKEDELYINKMEKLADDYESFFLSKNPRNYSKKDEKEDIKRKNSELKTLLKNLDSFDKSNEELKLQFLLSAVKYKPNLNHHILNLNKISQ